MGENQHLQHFRDAGAKAISKDGKHGHTQIQLQQKDVVFQQMFEYPVSDFEAEVGFYISVFGLPAIAMTDDYALFKHQENGYCISFRKDDSMPQPSTIGLKLLFMTTDIPGADVHLDQTGLVPDRDIRKGSPVQDVIHFSTPSGVAVEIWQMPTNE